MFLPLKLNTTFNYICCNIVCNSVTKEINDYSAGLSKIQSITWNVYQYLNAHAFSKYLLSTFHVPGMVLGLRDKTANPDLVKVIF